MNWFTQHLVGRLKAAAVVISVTIVTKVSVMGREPKPTRPLATRLI